MLYQPRIPGINHTWCIVFHTAHNATCFAVHTMHTMHWTQGRKGMRSAWSTCWNVASSNAWGWRMPGIGGQAQPLANLKGVLCAWKHWANVPFARCPGANSVHTWLLPMIVQGLWGTHFTTQVVNTVRGMYHCERRTKDRKLSNLRFQEWENCSELREVSWDSWSYLGHITNQWYPPKYEK